MRKILVILAAFAFLGLLDASYLTYEHYSNEIPPCSTNILSADCGKVLTSEYAKIFNIPVSVLGIGYYLLLLTFIFAVFRKNKKALKPLFFVSLTGLAMSLYFVYLQLVIINAICLYCMISATLSISIFALTSYYVITT
ncbi:vitamin K epoxide reductase family protein [soil metagenome]